MMNTKASITRAVPRSSQPVMRSPRKRAAQTIGSITDVREAMVVMDTPTRRVEAAMRSIEPK